MKKLFLICLSAVLILHSTVFAANPDILDESLYFGEASFYSKDESGVVTQLYEIEAGRILCCYTVLSVEKENVSMIAALYNSGAMEKVSSMTLTDISGKNARLTAEFEVPSAQGYEIRLYLTSNLDITAPMRTVAVLSERSRNTDVLSFALGGFKGKCDAKSKSITVEVPFDSELADMTEDVVLAEGASYELIDTDYENGAVMTVTSESGNKTSYRIFAVRDEKEFSYDFEDADAGEGIEVYDEVHWRRFSSANEETSETVESSDNGNAMILSDLSASKRVDVQAFDFAVSVPFEVNAKVLWNYADGITEHASPDDLSYCMFMCTSQKTINLNNNDSYLCGVEPVWNNTNKCYYLNYYKDGVRTRSNFKIDPSTAYNITMKYYMSDDGKYCTDYTFISEYGDILEINEVSSGKTYNVLDGLYMCTSPGRRAVMSYDDISIRELESKKFTGFTEDFSGDESIFDGAEVTDSPNGNTKAMKLENGEIKSAEAEFYGDSVQCSFDFTLSGNESEKASVFRLGDASELIIEAGTLHYANGSENVALMNTVIEDGKTYHMDVCYIIDTLYENTRVEYYLDGVLAGVSIPDAELDGSQTITFNAPGSGICYIENVELKLP